MSDSLNLRGVPCPTNSARTLIKLEMMECDEVLEVFLDEGEAPENVARSVETDGHEVLLRESVVTGWRLLIRKR